MKYLRYEGGGRREKGEGRRVKEEEESSKAWRGGWFVVGGER